MAETMTPTRRRFLRTTGAMALMPLAARRLADAAQTPTTAGRSRARDLGIRIGDLETGPLNAITDVPGVRVGHTTIIKGDSAVVAGIGPARTGVTAILPHDGPLAREAVTAAIYDHNGN